MATVTATEAGRNFSELLDRVEHHGQTFVVTRGGKPVARLSPTTQPNGRAVKEFLASHAIDPEWARGIEAVRAILNQEVEDPWNG